MSGQVWATNSLGGYMYSLNLSKKFRHALQPTMRFRQFCDLQNLAKSGKRRGQTHTWDVFSNVATGGTVLTETNTIPETNFTIQQGTLTVNEYGNSVPYSGVLDDLSLVPLKPIVTRTLRNDASKAIDTAAEAQFTLTPLRAAASGGTSTTAITLATTGTQTTTTSVAFAKGHAKAISDTMKERNIPAYTHGDYYAIAHPSTLRTFKNDLESIKQYTGEGFKMIINGEVGRYENTRYVEQTHIAKASTTYTDWIYFMGEETVGEAVVVPEEIRGKIPGDFGRSMGVAWYYLGGFGLAHTTAMGVTEARIIKWESAA